MTSLAVVVSWLKEMFRTSIFTPGCFWANAPATACHAVSSAPACTDRSTWSVTVLRRAEPVAAELGRPVPAVARTAATAPATTTAATTTAAARPRKRMFLRRLILCPSSWSRSRSLFIEHLRCAGAAVQCIHAGVSARHVATRSGVVAVDPTLPVDAVPLTEREHDRRGGRGREAADRREGTVDGRPGESQDGGPEPRAG